MNIWDKRIPGKRKSKNKSPKTRLYLGCSRKSKRASGASVEWAKKRMEGVRLSESSSRVSMFSQWPPRVTWTLVLLPYPILHFSFQSLFKCINKTTSSSSEIHEKKSKNFLIRAYKWHHLNPVNLSKLFHSNLLVMHNCPHMVVTFQTHQHSKLFPDLRYLHCCSFCLKCSFPRFSIVPSFLLNTPRCRIMLPDWRKSKFLVNRLHQSFSLDINILLI